MKQTSKIFFTTIASIVLFCSCSKYVGNTNNSSSNNTSVGATPIDPATGQGGGSTGSSSGTNTTDSVDGVYVQGFFAEDPAKTFFARNSADAKLTKIASNGYYTKLSKNEFTFYNPASNNDPNTVGSELGKVNFTTNGYYTIFLNKTNPEIIVLNNGNSVNPSTSKAYVRFLNATFIDTNVSINVKLTGSETAYFSYRTPYDVYQNASTVSSAWTSIYNQSYNTTNTNYTSLNPGSYNGEINLHRGTVFFPLTNALTPNYNFVGGKKYTIFVRQSVITFPRDYFYGIIQHN